MRMTGSIRPTSWEYGVMTVVSRKDTLLPGTLSSLVDAGFPTPRLFVDDCNDASVYTHLGLPITTRWPVLRVAGNWTLGVYELYMRNPHADAYAMFQDDIIACKDLRAYVEKTGIPANGYCNLYTAYANQRRMETQQHRRGWYTSNQSGFGALALIFTRDALVRLLSSKYLTERPQGEKGHKAIDGGIVTALKEQHVKEYVHMPGLVQHTGGDSSTLGHEPARNWDAESKCFIGAGISALTLL